MPASSIQGKCAKEWLALSSAFDTEVGWLDHSRRASFPGTNVALLIIDVERYICKSAPDLSTWKFSLKRAS